MRWDTGLGTALVGWLYVLQGVALVRGSVLCDQVLASYDEQADGCFAVGLLAMEDVLMVVDGGDVGLGVCCMGGQGQDMVVGAFCVIYKA